jgi:hypothetical protein
MQNPLTYHIPFDPKIALGQHNLRVKLTFKKNLTHNAKNLIYASIILLLAWLILSDKSSFGYFFLAYGLFTLSAAINYYRYYLKTSKKLGRLHQDMVDVRTKNNDVMTWEFGDDLLGCKDMYYDFSIKWAAFKGYKIVEKNLFLQLAETIDQFYIIGEEEVGAAGFNNIIAFVGEKISNLGE